jgi:hypothetical protein
VVDAGDAAGTIAIRPDARTEWPSRELIVQHTPKDRARRSRLGERIDIALRRRVADAEVVDLPSSAVVLPRPGCIRAFDFALPKGSLAVRVATAAEFGAICHKSWNIGLFTQFYRFIRSHQ